MRRPEALACNEHTSRSTGAVDRTRRKKPMKFLFTQIVPHPDRKSLGNCFRG
jgi:hypothetical protein